MKKLTFEEKEFLIALQKELNTQDNLGTNYPYWTICDYKKVYAKEFDMEADGFKISIDGAEIIRSNDIFDENFLDKLIDDIQEYTELTKSDIKTIKFTGTAVLVEDLIENLQKTSLADIAEILPYKKVETTTGVFLTRKAAKEYFSRKRNRFSDEAYLYCASNYDSSERMLWEILKKIEI